MIGYFCIPIYPSRTDGNKYSIHECKCKHLLGFFK
nr:MAG TPA: hypothetical protein [Caudoviricetes sp.]DAM89143.1 MAG TPA: hypothetical protein [Caudoviricetes sp.]DAO68010.1 MAG TPA: hypothetical protein [Caudoviricetes sp.]DAW72074.1 MAG TPA: hypothetical protein [Caudoviricetes sp.]